MLLNETYTGRSVYRRMKAEKYRDGKSGRWKVRVSERSQEDWIEIAGATPTIVSPSLYLRAKAILEDPHRRSRSKPSRFYPLRGRLRCHACGAPMVGQTLMKGRYSYYRRRHSYGGQWDSQCPSKYVSTRTLEGAVLNALADLLSNPDRILTEARRLCNEEIQTGRLDQVTQELRQLEAKQRRLVRLFTDGGSPTEILDEQRRELSTERGRLEDERQKLELANKPGLDIEALRSYLPELSRRVRAWVDAADGDRLDLLLRATDAQVSASSAEAHIRGTIPMIEHFEPQDLVTTGRTSA